MNLTNSRALLRQWGSDTADTVLYSNSDVDRAIQALGDDLAFHTNVTRTTDTENCTADDPDLDLSGLTDFKAERILGIYLTDPDDSSKEYDLDIIDAGQMRALRRADDSSTTPELIAFTSDTDARLYPTPDVAYVATVEWKAPFTSFTAGTATPDTVDLNIPDEYWRTALMLGGTALLQHTDPKRRYASESWLKYVEFRNLIRGRAGSRAVRSFTRGEDE